MSGYIEEVPGHEDCFRMTKTGIEKALDWVLGRDYRLDDADPLEAFLGVSTIRDFAIEVDLPELQRSAEVALKPIRADAQLFVAQLELENDGETEV